MYNFPNKGLGKSLDDNKQNTNEKVLLQALRNDNLSQALQLIQSPATNVNYQNENGISALHIAAQKGQLTIVEALLACNDIIKNSVDKQRFDTPLHTAARAGQVETFIAIAKSEPSYRAGFNGISAINKQGNSVLDVASETVRPKFQAALKSIAYGERLRERPDEYMTLKAKVADKVLSKLFGQCLFSRSAKLDFNQKFQRTLAHSDENIPLSNRLSMKQGELGKVTQTVNSMSK